MSASVNEVLGEAARLEKEYEWLQASGLYEQALSMVDEGARALDVSPEPVPIFIEIDVASHYGFGHPETISIYELLWNPVIIVVS